MNANISLTNMDIVNMGSRLYRRRCFRMGALDNTTRASILYQFCFVYFFFSKFHSFKFNIARLDDPSILNLYLGKRNLITPNITFN